MFRSDSIDVGNRNYQRQIAESLIGNMGMERAVYACQANGWDGVLENVLCYADRSRHVDTERVHGCPIIPCSGRQIPC